MSYALVHAVLGAAVFGLALAWWERGDGPAPDQGRLAPWVFARLVAALWLLSLAVVGVRAGAGAWAAAPVALVVLMPWWFTRLGIAAGAPAWLLVPCAWLSALVFDGDTGRARRYLELLVARRRRDPRAAHALTQAHILGPLHALAGASARLYEGELAHARAWLDTVVDFATPLPAPALALLHELDAELELRLAPAPMPPPLRRVLDMLEGPTATPPLREWEARVDERGLDSKALRLRCAQRLRALHAPTTPDALAHFGPTLVALEARLEAPASLDRTSAALEWDTWVQIRSAIIAGSEAEIALRLATAEPALIALAARSWSDQNTRSFAGAVLTFLERHAARVQDHARAERARRNLSLVA